LANSIEVKIAPSLLSADFSQLGKAVELVANAGADSIHVDIMDGHFVPSITWGPKTVEAIRKWSDLPLDIHLMIYNPEKHIDSFIAAGANTVNVHLESCTNLNRIIDQIKSAGARAGVAINPSTPVTAIEEILPFIDQVLVMSVNPGLPAQKYIAGTEKKISTLRKIIDSGQMEITLEVDGGINRETARIVAMAGADILVAGSAIYDYPGGIEEAITTIRMSTNSQEN
jgi:ribulose-phosphate 3-epimerase